MLSALSLWALSDILFPFVVALIAAYFLDPAADRLQTWGCSRMNAVLLIIAAFFGTILLAGALVFPMLAGQLSALVERLPEYAAALRSDVIPDVNKMLQKIDPDYMKQAQDAIGGISKGAIGVAAGAAKSVWLSGMALVDVLSLVFITPVVTYYMMKDWDDIAKAARDCIPRRCRETVLSCLGEIDDAMAGYIRGQTAVCLILAAYYSVGLSLAGLEYALFVGLATGLLCFIPYVGFGVGMAAGMAIAFLQFPSWHNVAAVAGVFMVGQVVESTVLTPKLVGGRVRLSPAWVIFGIMAGGALFGFAGVLLAVPVSAAVGVVARRACGAYLRSGFYNS
jgi:predicted PurR-regulated permease PerM